MQRVNVSVIAANDGIGSSLQCAKAPVLSTDRPWTPATSTASLTALRYKAAFISWSQGFLGNCLLLLEESWRTVSQSQHHIVFFFIYLHRDDFKNIPPLDAKKLEVFRTVREITGVYMSTRDVRHVPPRKSKSYFYLCVSVVRYPEHPVVAQRTS